MLAQYTFVVAHHEAQELKLGGRQIDQLAVAGHLVAVLVQDKVAHDQSCVAAVARDSRPTQ
ncbi:Uncharacterised protein [Mycobacteroides abscessus subsp. abscessus]|nr:Uncharacterised protein [Mycobacteroides abscessus subsp. abscessus]SLJ81457.1 Uncharacterised protein [Mycobacteroides abscessus subsp. abscessus]SLJ81568.1 Uncharacterised protein [Mycobacteroides abscessus subsp. abscessus]